MKKHNGDIAWKRLKEVKPEKPGLYWVYYPYTEHKNEIRRALWNGEQFNVSVTIHFWGEIKETKDD